MPSRVNEANKTNKAGRVARRGQRARHDSVEHHDDRAVLLVENSASVAQMVAAYLLERCGRQSHWAKTLAHARTLLQAHAAADFMAAVVNLELPDASDEEIVSLTLSHGVPTIVLTGTFSESKRQRILRHDIVDYCLKGKTGVEALVQVIERLQRNPGLKVLLVDDVAGSRAQQLALLNAQRFDVVQATSAEQALALYRERERAEYALVLVSLASDQRALTLIGDLRELAHADELAVIGLSNAETSHTPAQYLKAGANDFLAKPFEKEEYLCRLYGSVDRASNMRRIQQLAFTDSLTGVANRLSFFRQVPERLKEAVRERSKPAIALLTIDQLHQINELHGYNMGDLALQHVVRNVTKELGPGALCARFSGQQFSVFLRNAPPMQLAKLFERVRETVEQTPLTHAGQPLQLSVSCGVIACEADETLDAYLNRADTALDDAVSNGGNCVVLRA
jgi:diguanylate cyclase (GGDEF)-like protein